MTFVLLQTLKYALNFHYIETLIAINKQILFTYQYPYLIWLNNWLVDLDLILI